MTTKPPTTLAEMDAAVAAFVASPGAIEQLQATTERARAASQKVLADAKVTRQQLQEPMTI